MKKYEVNLKETSYGFITVTAENEDQARAVAIEQAQDGCDCWHDVDYETTEVREIQ